MSSKCPRRYKSRQRAVSESDDSEYVDTDDKTANHVDESGDSQNHEGITRNSKRLAFDQGKNQKVEDQGFKGSKDWSTVKQGIRVDWAKGMPFGRNIAAKKHDATEFVNSGEAPFRFQQSF
ncbi:hypothetical protein AgCh_022831 [Apium graveolens]